jgi:hypothetical protein
VVVFGVRAVGVVGWSYRFTRSGPFHTRLGSVRRIGIGSVVFQDCLEGVLRWEHRHRNLMTTSAGRAGPLLEPDIHASR